MRNIIRKPLITEKNTDHSGRGIYAFEVDRKATKDDIRLAVEKAFEVNVMAVNTMLCRDRTRRTRLGVAPKRYWKKALIKLKAGQKIDLFEGA